MALTTTSLAAPITANDLAFVATSATGATVGGFVRIDDEFMAVTAIAGTLISVRSRGDYGSQAVAHQGLSSVVFGLASDLAPLGTSETIPVPAAFDMATIGVNGAIPVPTRHTVYFLTKATALAATLADPSASQDGLTISLVGCTNAAHVITAAGLIYDGTDGANSICTSAAYIGSCCTLIAYGGKWHTKANNLMVFTVP